MQPDIERERDLDLNAAEYVRSTDTSVEVGGSPVVQAMALVSCHYCSTTVFLPSVLFFLFLVVPTKGILPSSSLAVAIVPLLPMGLHSQFMTVS